MPGEPPRTASMAARRWRTRSGWRRTSAAMMASVCAKAGTQLSKGDGLSTGETRTWSANVAIGDSQRSVKSTTRARAAWAPRA